MDCQRIVVLGNEYSANAVFYYLEKYLIKASKPFDLLFISNKNYYFFDELLSDYLCDTLNQNEICQDLRSLYLIRPGVSYLETPELSINFASRTIKTIKGNIDYKYLVIALENNLEEAIPKIQLTNHLNCFNFATPQDVISLKKHIIENVEKASSEQEKEIKSILLTFSIIGGTSSEITLACAISDYLNNLLKKNYPELSRTLLKINLIAEKDLIVSKECPFYNSRLFYNLNKKKITIYPNSVVTQVQGSSIEINNDRYIDSGTIIFSKKPESSFLGNDLLLKKDGMAGWYTDLYLRRDGYDDVFVVGKSSQCLDLSEDIPKTIIFYNQQAKICATNVLAKINNNPLKPLKPSLEIDFFQLGYRNTLVAVKDFYFSGSIGWLFYRLVFILSFLGWKKQLRAFVALLLNIFGLTENEILNIYKTSEEKTRKKIKV